MLTVILSVKREQLVKLVDLVVVNAGNRFPHTGSALCSCNWEKRWVRAVKSNFDESGYTPVRLVLDKDRKLSFLEFEEAEVHEEQRPLTRIEQAIIILKESLASRAVSVEDAHAILAEEGIGIKTTQQARQRNGAIQDYSNGTPIRFNKWMYLSLVKR